MKIFLTLIFFSSSVLAITADELREISGRADREQREKANRLNINDLDSFLPALKKDTVEESPLPPEVKKPDLGKAKVKELTASDGGKKGDKNLVTVSSETKPVEKARPRPGKYTKSESEQPKSTKYRKPAIIEKATGGSNIKRTIEIQQSNPDEYIPPARIVSGSSSNSGTSDIVVIKQRRYGIPLGTWFKATMNRSTTNSDPGLIELITIADVEGKHKILPAGTYLFSEKEFNAGTKRLDLHVIKARLPDGDEIEVDGLAYDSTKVAGLQGIIVENNSDAVESGFKTGLINAGKSLVEQGSAGSVSGTILSSTTDSLADTQQASIEAQTRIPFTVHVSPQPVFIQVQTTF